LTFSGPRLPAVSGTFYPGTEEALSSMVTDLLNDAEKKEIDGELVALIVPHAGYIYSGPVAAYAYNLLEEEDYGRIVLLGGSHRTRYVGASAADYDSYVTPLGTIPVDREVVSALLGSGERLSFHPEAHGPEHSLEVQLPFLQEILEDFTIVPILFGDHDFKTCESVRDALLETVPRERTLFVISTDLSHYYPYDQAVALDSRTVDEILTLDAKGLFNGITDWSYECCGGSAVVTGLLLAKALGADAAELLEYANSGDTAGDKSRVVGYAAIALYKRNQDQGGLSPEAREELLDIARGAIRGYLETRTYPSPNSDLPEIQRTRISRRSRPSREPS
jgi:AmmeMemoRadiSam system protein B